MDSDTRTPEEIQKDIDRERAELSNTLHSLNDNLSIGNISATITDQVRQLSSDVLGDLAGTVVERAREKPIAAGLVFAGLAWMALGSTNRHTAPDASQHVSTSEPSRDPQDYQLVAARERRQTSAGESAHADANDRIERLEGDAKSLRDRVAEGTENLSDEARARVIQAREAAADAAEKSVNALRTGAGKAKDVVQDNPFAVGGIALALGAAIGGVMLMRTQEKSARDARNELFRQADRIMSDEVARATPRQGTKGSSL